MIYTPIKNLNILKLVQCLLISFICQVDVLMAQSPFQHDLVLSNGRVIDPETNLDAIRNVGIRNGRIEQITAEPIFGKETVDVSGLVVAPGFIDLHVHGISNTEQEYQAHDGVTTAMELEWGLSHLKEWYASRESKAIINYGASVSWSHARGLALNSQTDSFEINMKKDPVKALRMANWQLSAYTAEPSFYKPLSSYQMELLYKNLQNELNAGGIGIGVPIGYHPGATREEVFQVNKFSADINAPIFMHVREGGTLAIQQAISDAVLTGASLHLVHLNSMSLGEIDLCIEMVNAAQQKGFRITSEIYPYTAASTSIQSALFDDGWQQKFGITYKDLQLVSTGERLTQSTFAKYRKSGGMVVMHMMKPEWIKSGIKSGNIMIASDGMPYAKLAHPRTAGTYARVLGKYVRQDKVITLAEAIRKMTLMPALRLEEIAPSMRFKGRLQVGADADIVIFNPESVTDKASFDKGLEFSEGIIHVLVGGTFVVKDTKTVSGVFPGRPVYGKFKK